MQIAGIASLFADLLIRLGALKAAVMLHLLLLGRMMRLPMCFFDTTPVGRIMSRFSKDIDTLDQTLVEILADAIWCAFEVIPPSFTYPFLSPLPSKEESS